MLHSRLPTDSLGLLLPCRIWCSGWNPPSSTGPGRSRKWSISRSDPVCHAQPVWCRHSLMQYEDATAIMWAYAMAGGAAQAAQAGPLAAVQPQPFIPLRRSVGRPAGCSVVGQLAGRPTGTASCRTRLLPSCWGLRPGRQARTGRPGSSSAATASDRAVKAPRLVCWLQRCTHILGAASAVPVTGGPHQHAVERRQVC